MCISVCQIVCLLVTFLAAALPSVSYVLSTKQHVVVLGVVFLLHVC